MSSEAAIPTLSVIGHSLLPSCKVDTPPKLDRQLLASDLQSWDVRGDHRTPVHKLLGLDWFGETHHKPRWFLTLLEELDSFRSKSLFSVAEKIKVCKPLASRPAASSFTWDRSLNSTGISSSVISYGTSKIDLFHQYFPTLQNGLFSEAIILESVRDDAWDRKTPLCNASSRVQFEPNHCTRPPSPIHRRRWSRWRKTDHYHLRESFLMPNVNAVRFIEASIPLTVCVTPITCLYNG